MAIVVPVITTFDAKGIGKAIANFKKLETGAQKTAFTMRALDQSATAVVKTMAKFGVIAVAAAGVVGNKLVQSASALEESMSKVQVVFGSASAEVVRFADEAAKNIGISKQAALEATGTYGNLLQAFGIGQQGAQQMSTQLVQLAADLASFNNANIDDVLLALRSGLSGETEPLKRFGIAINDVRLKEQALSDGLIKTAKGVLPVNIKAQAAFALIMKDSSLAQGDFARTSDGVANMMRILKASFDDVRAELGTALLPAFKALLTYMQNTVLPVVREFADILSEEGIGAALKFLGGKILDFIQGLDGFGEKVYWVIAAFIALKAAVIAYTVIQGLATLAATAFGVAWNATGIGLIVSAIAALGVGLVAAYIKFEGFRKVVNPIINVFITLFEALINDVVRFINIIIRAANVFNWVFRKMGFDVEDLGTISHVAFGRVGNSASKATVKLNDTLSKIQAIKNEERKLLEGPRPDTPDPDPDPTGGESAVERAKRQVQEYTSALNKLKDSQRGVADASERLRDANKKVADSASATKRANQQLADATEAVGKAEQMLDLIRRGLGSQSMESKRAAERVEAAQRNLESSGYDLEEAQFAVQDATLRLSELRMAEEAPSLREVREAEISLARTKLSLIEQQIRQREVTTELNDAQREYDEITNGASEDTERFKEALKELNDAKKAQEDATKAVTDAMKDEVDAVDAVREAQEKLRDATWEIFDAEKALKELRDQIPKALQKKVERDQARRDEMNAPGVVIPDGVTDFFGGVTLPMNVPAPYSAESLALYDLAGGFSSGGTVININTTSLDPAASADIVVESLRQYERTNGFIPVIVEGLVV